MAESIDDRFDRIKALLTKLIELVEKQPTPVYYVPLVVVAPPTTTYPQYYHPTLPPGPSWIVTTS